MARKRRGEAHVRLYRHELDCAAYRTLSTDARALLVELRGLFGGTENRVFMSVREAMRRLGDIGQRRAQRAIAELLERGWIIEIQRGDFRWKVRHATEYALGNHPLTDRDGAVAPKGYMKWRPAEENSVAVTTTHGSRSDYREDSREAAKGPDGSRSDYREAPNSGPHGSRPDYTDKLPPSRGYAFREGEG